MENTKCECGHNNPVGTILCEYCGKPLDESESSGQPLEMRYEGKARRSQTQNATWFDRVWNFFSSVKVAVYLIVIALLASVLGTLLPQEQYIPSNRPDAYYPQKYGTIGDIYYQLGLHHMYESWWFITLLSMIGISLVVCSLDRVIPLYQALKNQRVEKNISFILRQRIHQTVSTKEEEKESALDKWMNTLQRKGYRVRREGDSLLAEKGRFSRWGPYVIHIGLILFLFGVLLRLLPGWAMDEFVYVREGQIKKIPETPFYVKNVKADIELYDPKEMPQKLEEQTPVVKKYETDAILYEKNASGRLKPVHRDAIVVNEPMEYKGLLLYQADFQPNQPEAIRLAVKDKKTKKKLGSIRINLYDPKPTYALKNGVTVRILDYFPDFIMDGNRPTTKSENPNRPAFIFEVDSPKLDEPEKSWMIAGTNLDDLNRKNRYTMDLEKIETVNVSGLKFRTEKSLPVILFGGIVAMIGLVMGFFWFHRRVWIRWAENQLYIGAHTNKNWYGIRRELEQVSKECGLQLSFTPEEGQGNQ
jgi:cytochrome c biogenesis protein